MKEEKEEREYLEKVKIMNSENEEWENSIEGVMYNLHTIGDAFVSDEEDKLLIAKTLLKIPKEIREKVLDEVTFIHHQIYGIVCNFHLTGVLDSEDIKQQIGDRTFFSKNAPLILLNFGLMRNEKVPESVIMDIVAHEIAHFVLGHHTIEKSHDPHNEREADDLVEKWGFVRVYSEEQLKKFDRNKK